MLELSMREARRLAIGAQLLAGPPPKRPTKERMRDVIRHLGALQIDSISVVERSHHIVLWSRLGNHPRDWLYELHGKDRALFEYWAHAAAYVPIENFRYFRRMMLEHASNGSTGWGSRSREWLDENRHVIDLILDRVREQGAVSTKSFAAPEGAARAEAWAWHGNKPTNLGLDILWTTGVLMIDRRQAFQRWYDLTERVHPEWDDAQIPTIQEEQNALGEIALRAMGVVYPRWLPDYFRTDWGRRSIDGSASGRILDHLVDTGAGVTARVRGIEGEAVVASYLLEKRIPPSRTTLLSPFDSLVWHRLRTSELFDFFLQLESYTPAEMRRYGYFSLPILYRDQLVGRLDPKADRNARVLTAKAVHLEPWFAPKADERFYRSLATTLRDFARFNGCDAIEIGAGDPPRSATLLKDAMLRE
ncbi:MAG TPA: crosslink repair DNA glycosylase YcaQ family protein [Thermomicrobiales bacterium]|nr:crosslink repair DNA glycosylase YcaQ family protein [Thermomicrobiales bacterium]